MEQLLCCFIIIFSIHRKCLSIVNQTFSYIYIVSLIDTFELMIVTKTENTHIIYQYVQSVYDELLLLEQISESASTQPDPDVQITQLKEVLSRTNNEQLFSIQTNSFRDGKTGVIDSQLQAIFGFSLFFVIYTIAYNVLPILEEKNNGVWDRMIISPMKKWEMYTGNLLYSFIVGYIQVVFIYLFFYYGIGVNFYGGFGKSLLLLIPYIFSIVALSIFITGFVKNSSQFNAVIPLISVIMAMIGGAYWPLEIVSSKVLLAISKFIPITHSMESLKMATVYGNTTNELMLPTSILLLMGVIMMAIGIHLMERK